MLRRKKEQKVILQRVLLCSTVMLVGANELMMSETYDCEVRTHASFDNGDLSELKTIALDFEGH
jgi:hypothetical protein